MTTRTLAAALALSICLLAGASSASAAGPGFKLTATSQPTNFVAGSEPVASTQLDGPMPQFSLIATNVGLAPTSGPIVMRIVLPPELTPTEEPIPPVANDSNENPTTLFRELPCDIAGQIVTCSDPKSLQSGQFMQVHVPVKVDPAASGTLVSQVSVEGGGAAEAATSIETTVSDELAPFGFAPGSGGFSFTATAGDGTPATQAGSHPSQLTVDLGFPTRQFHPGTEGAQPASVAPPKDIRVTLPRGMIVNPEAMPARCTEAQLNNETGHGCPLDSQIGAIYVETSLGGGVYPYKSPLYNMVPPPGAPAEFAFNAVNVGVFIHLLARVNAAGEYELGTDVPNILARNLNPLMGSQAQFWGDSSDPAHDPMRGVGCGNCTVNRHDAPVLTMPSSCRETLTATAEADSWVEPDRRATASAQLEDPFGNPVGTDGCNQLDFAPEVEAKPTTNLSDAPSGLEFDLKVPQTAKIDERATANFKDIEVKLPEGMAVNPSSANGQGACSASQIGLATPIGQSQARFSEAPASCPENAKIGSVEVTTPLLDHQLNGGIYLAKPFDNPFNSLIAIYLDVEDPQTGVVSKLAGKVSPDPSTGQLTATFGENPELPIEEVKTIFFKGPRAPLTTPLACGTHSTQVRITPWSSPEGVDANLSDPFDTSVAASGSGPCPGSEAAAPEDRSFSAGTIAPQAGSFSPFVFKLSRADGTRRLTGIDTTLPKGLLAKLAGISYCPEAGIARAISRSKPGDGATEQSDPSCPASSQVGTIDVAAGAGITPLYTHGRAYLAGPYKGAPLSLVIVTPAVAGPFDLGAVTVRVALQVDPETAKVRAVSDPLPTILYGIPLDIRSIGLTMDRPQFTLNPTSCDPMEVTGTATSALGQAALKSPFQVGGCSALGFKPKLAFALKGSTERAGHPALKATVTYPKGAYANIGRAQVTLPRSEFLDQSHIKTICTRVQFAAKSCPARAIYGRATAITPLLGAPLSGPVYLRSSSHELPDLVADLNGQIEIVLDGRIDSIGGGIRTTFESVPDAPISKFTLEMQGGKKGLLVNSTNLCRRTNRAVALFDAQNGKTYDSKPALAVSCKGKGRKGKRHGKAHR